MGKRQKIWARKRRQELIEQLGGRCAYCHSTHHLEFDHKNPKDRTWSNKGKDASTRICIYAREIKKKLIQLLCSECNKLKQDGLIPF